MWDFGLYVLLNWFLVIPNLRCRYLTCSWKSSEHVDSNFRIIRWLIQFLKVKTPLSCDFSLWYHFQSCSVSAKRAQNEHFLSMFFAICKRVRCLITKPFRERNNLVKYYQKHYYCFGITPITFEKIAKNTSKSSKLLILGLFGGGSTNCP